MPQASARTASCRPRVEGDREQQVFDATLEVLGEVGYDKLTLDKVAARARAGKATLYRRWPSKAELVADAMASLDGGVPVPPDTGSLRGDLVAMSAEREDGLLDPARMPLLIGLLTAMYRDTQLSSALRCRVVDSRRSCLVTVLERAKARGEVAEEVDADLVAGVVPAMILFWLTVEGRTDVAALIPRVVDEILLPAVLRRSD